MMIPATEKYQEGGQVSGAPNQGSYGYGGGNDPNGKAPASDEEDYRIEGEPKYEKNIKRFLF